MAVKRGYKQTEVGVIPEDWLDPQLQQIVEEDSPICYGIVQVGPFIAGGIPVLAIKNLNPGKSSVHRASSAVERSYARSRIRPGDVVISVKGTIGRTGIVPDRFIGNISRDLARIRPRQEISAQFIHQMLQSGIAQRRLVAATVGTTRMELSISVLKQVRIPLPPTKIEQETISEVLRDTDGLIESLEQLLAKKRQILQGTMQELLTGRRRLPGFEIQRGREQTDIGTLPRDWEVAPLSSLFNFQNGINADKKFYGQGSPFINVLEVIKKPYLRVVDLPGRISLSRSRFDAYKVRRGDVMFNRTSETQEEIGLASVFLDEMPVVFGGFVIRGRRIAGAPVLPEYAAQVLRTAVVHRQIIARGQGAIRANIGQADLRTVLMPLPPLREQQAITAVLTDMDAEITALEAKLAKARQIKQGMMQELLTGRIRLV